jgi:putative flippase GtrA
VRRFAAYSAIGVLGAVIDLGLFVVLYEWGNVARELATAVSTIVAIAHNFVLNALFTFRVRDRLLVRLLSFYAVGVTGVLLTIGLFRVLVDGAGLDVTLVKALSLPLVAVIQFGLNSVTTFRASR